MKDSADKLKNSAESAGKEVLHYGSKFPEFVRLTTKDEYGPGRAIGFAKMGSLNVLFRTRKSEVYQAGVPLSKIDKIHEVNDFALEKTGKRACALQTAWDAADRDTVGPQKIAESSGLWLSDSGVNEVQAMKIEGDKYVTLEGNGRTEALRWFARWNSIDESTLIVPLEILDLSGPSDSRHRETVKSTQNYMRPWATPQLEPKICAMLARGQMISSPEARPSTSSPEAQPSSAYSQIGGFFSSIGRRMAYLEADGEMSADYEKWKEDPFYNFPEARAVYESLVAQEAERQRLGAEGSSHKE